MATTPKNRIVQSVAPKSLFPEASVVVDATISYNQGDILFISSGLITPVVAEASGTTVLGIAPQTVVLGKPRSAYSGTAVDAAQAIEALAGPVYGVVAKLKLKVGDSFTPGALVYATAVDAQTVSITGTHPIGIFQGAAVTAVSGSEGPVLLGAIANGVLQF
jgi:hypothetical protein